MEAKADIEAANKQGHPQIVIAGASGYIGKALIPKLLEKFPNARIIALSRTQAQSDDPRVVWRPCDLFSLKGLEEALPSSVDLAFYLVHSMGPTASLDQGSFADYDLILADNFSRAMRRTGVQQVIYLGGLLPETKEISLHLQSRHEMEETFQVYGLPTTVFRAGLIVGDQGSSFQILLKLVKRLPLMVCPAWTQTRTSPVDLKTVLKSLVAASLDEKHIGRTYDLAGCQPLTYIEMMRETGRKMGLRRSFVTVPVFTPTLSRLWVTLITNTPRGLVYPLIQSLKHPMVNRPSAQFSDEWQRKTYFDMLEGMKFQMQPAASLFRFRGQRNTVRSVQRMSLPPGKNSEFVANEYLAWLPKFLAPLVQVWRNGPDVELSAFGRKLLLLELRLLEERSTPDRQVFLIRKGLLVGAHNRGRLEFRVVLNGRYILAAIHDYRPALPWYLYVYSQALVHLFVMNAFGRHLDRMDRALASPAAK